jgi:hypothetical protein
VFTALADMSRADLVEGLHAGVYRRSVTSVFDCERPSL